VGRLVDKVTPKKQDALMVTSSPLPDRDPKPGDFAKFWLEQRPDLNPEVLMLELTMARLNLLSIKSIDRIAGKHGISAADYLFMNAISRGRADGPLRPSDLGRLFGLQPSVVTYRVNQLVERHLVDRSTKADDRRVIQLSLTQRGIQIVHEIMTAQVLRLDERLKSIDEIDHGRRTLQELLGALAAGWERLEAQELAAASESDVAGSPLQDRG
jgi:DNA-binding MarR family transcriptional regulator